MTGNALSGKLDRTRQQGLISDKLFKSTSVTLIGAGGIGSPTALYLAKMGVETLIMWDEDGVNAHNIPNTLYRKKDVGQFKVDALEKILQEFSDVMTLTMNHFYEPDKDGKYPSLSETVIVVTDSMESRQIVWEQFLKQNQCRHYIEARMGAKLGMVYTFSKQNRGYGKWSMMKKDIHFYQGRLYKDGEVKPLPCTAKSIIYNTGMIAALICRAYESLITKEKGFPREQIFNMTKMDERSWMLTR
jgi:hypothetical protein